MDTLRNHVTVIMPPNTNVLRDLQNICVRQDCTHGIVIAIDKIVKEIQKR